MAGVYIHGMEMPESCYYCPFADGVWQKDKRCLINGKEMPWDGRDVQQNHVNCPLVPVPDHGDLIDRDALCEGRVSNDNVVICAKAAPTIIPADKEGEE